MMRRARVLTLALGVLTVPAFAATVTVTDCVSDPHIVVNPGTDTTRIDAASDDLVLACALSPLGGTHRVALDARNITVQGPAGRVSASGDTKAIVITASGTFSAVSAAIESTNGNGEAEITAGGDMTFDGTTVAVGSATSGGNVLTIACSDLLPPCKLTASDSTFKSRIIRMTAVGDLTLSEVAVTTNSPRDLIFITSSAGNVKLGGVCGGNSVASGNEGELRVSAFGYVDLSSANVLVAEEIEVTSGVGPGPSPVPAYIDLSGASIRNDFGKPGEIVILADEGLATIDVEGAVIIDDDQVPGDVAELNGRESLPHTGHNNVVGTPETDG
jgi:hypothetical protein